MKQYDMILIGNGSSINLKNQLNIELEKIKKNKLIKEEDTFKEYIQNTLNNKLDDLITLVFEEFFVINYPISFVKRTQPKFYKYAKKEYTKKIKNCLKKYLLKSNNSMNIEKFLYLMKIDKDITIDEENIMHTFLPIFFNLIDNENNIFIKKEKLMSFVENYNNNIFQYMKSNAKIYTTNFDNYLEPLNDKVEYIHGKYIYNKYKYQDFCVIKRLNKDIFSTLWSDKDNGKDLMIYTFLHDIEFNNYFDWNFFKDDTLKTNDILVYGMSFQGTYILQEKLKNNEKVSDEYFKDNIIDNHIITRIKEFQDINPYSNITVTYYSDYEKNYLEKVFSIFEINNVEFKHCSKFNFSIY